MESLEFPSQRWKVVSFTGVFMMFDALPIALYVM